MLYHVSIHFTEVWTWNKSQSRAKVMRATSRERESLQTLICTEHHAKPSVV